MQGEKENIEMLQGLMPGLDEAIARRVLLKHKGDLQAAATAVLEGDTGQEQSLTWPADFEANNRPLIVTRANTPECTCGSAIVYGSTRSNWPHSAPTQQRDNCDRLDW